jgi:hypothetical protein
MDCVKFSNITTFIHRILLPFSFRIASVTMSSQKPTTILVTGINTVMLNYKNPNLMLV